MKISNFQFIKTVKGKDAYGFTEIFTYGTVDVTTKKSWLFGKAVTTTRPVFKKDILSWRFQDTGEWTPSYTVEALYEAYLANKVMSETKTTKS